MKPSVNTLLWSIQFTEKHFPVLAEIKKAGADYVELPVIVEQTAAEFGHIHQAVKDEGLAVSSVVTVMNADNDPSRPETSQAALNHLRKVVDALMVLTGGGPGIVCGPIVGPLGERPTVAPTEWQMNERWRQAADVLVLAAAHANPYANAPPVTFAIEPLNRFELVAANRLAHAAAIARLAHHARVGVMFDTHHMHMTEGAHPDIALEHFLNVGLIVHGHISHHNRGIPGVDDQINYAPYFQALRYANYQGFLAIEAFGRYPPEEQALQAATCTWHPNFGNPMDVVHGGIRLIKSLSRGE